jgi:hypothetical protein
MSESGNMLKILTSFKFKVKAVNGTESPHFLQINPHLAPEVSVNLRHQNTVNEKHEKIVTILSVDSIQLGCCR